MSFLQLFVERLEEEDEDDDEKEEDDDNEVESSR